MEAPDTTEAGMAGYVNKCYLPHRYGFQYELRKYLDLFYRRTSYLFALFALFAHLLPTARPSHDQRSGSQGHLQGPMERAHCQPHRVTASPRLDGAAVVASPHRGNGLYVGHADAFILPSHCSIHLIIGLEHLHCDCFPARIRNSRTSVNFILAQNVFSARRYSEKVQSMCLRRTRQDLDQGRGTGRA